MTNKWFVIYQTLQTHFWCKQSHWDTGFLWDERASTVPRQLPLTAVCRVQTADRQVSVLHSNTNTSMQTELDLFICRTLSLARTKGNGVTSLHKNKETVLCECRVEKTTVASSELKSSVHWLAISIHCQWRHHNILLFVCLSTQTYGCISI